MRTINISNFSPELKSELKKADSKIKNTQNKKFEDLPIETRNEIIKKYEEIKTIEKIQKYFN